MDVKKKLLEIDIIKLYAIPSTGFCYQCHQMKLREGNVFTGVCLSFCSVGWEDPHVTITRDVLGHGYPHSCIPDMGHNPSTQIPDMLLTFGGRHWKPVNTVRLHSVTSVTPSGGHETHMVGKWAVHILLKCCLVIKYFELGFDNYN